MDEKNNARGCTEPICSSQKVEGGEARVLDKPLKVQHFKDCFMSLLILIKKRNTHVSFKNWQLYVEISSESTTDLLTLKSKGICHMLGTS